MITNQYLLYKDFEKIILDFQLKEHERFLSKFNLKFKAYDSDHDGVLNEQEFKELLRNLKVIDKEEDIEFLLQQVDPFNNQKMTYSQIVSALSQHTVNHENQQVPVLEKFVN